MSAPHLPVLPESITVVRESGDRKFALFIDGVEFPYAVDGVAGASVAVELKGTPSVTITLLAKSVHVSDALLAGLDLSHEHADEDEVVDAEVVHP